MTQLYLNKLLRTSSDQASHRHLLLKPQNTGYFVHLPYGTGKKKYYTIHIHRINTNIKKNYLNSRNTFMLKSVSQLTRPCGVSLLNI